MHWLPLVAMVIASALPFPHNPVSSIVAATTTAAASTEPGSDSRGNASHADFAQRPNGQDLHDRKDDVKPSAHEDAAAAAALTAETRGTKSSSGSGGVSLDGRTLRTPDISKDNSLPKDDDRRDDSGFMDFYKKDGLQDSTGRPLQVSAAENHNTAGPGATLTAPTVPSEQLRATSTIAAGTEPAPGAEEAGPGLGPGVDSLLGDEMFLDAHPRVLFSPSLSPPEHPPLLLMLESGLLEDEQEDMDGHIEGHGDRAIDRTTEPSWTDSSRVGAGEAAAAARPVKRDKRSHLMDRRRGEKSVCESESFWVTDKDSAIDSRGRQVTILPEIQTQTGPLKQFFYETRCRPAEQESVASRGRGSGAAPRSPGMGLAGSGCFGVDKKQWLSECKAKQSFVRALTKDANNRIGWRWIRIDSSCVCVLLSRANQGREVLTRTGRG